MNIIIYDDGTQERHSVVQYVVKACPHDCLSSFIKIRPAPSFCLVALELVGLMTNLSRSLYFENVLCVVVACNST